MYFNFPRLLIILIINCHSNLQEKLSLLVQVLLNEKHKFKKSELNFLFFEIFFLICFYSIKLTTYDDFEQDEIVDEILAVT